MRASPAGADKGKQVTSLIEEFKYPKYGPGMMWERCRELVERGRHRGRLELAGACGCTTPTAEP